MSAYLARRFQGHAPECVVSEGQDVPSTGVASPVATLQVTAAMRAWTTQGSSTH
jgi:hypothetical protein